MTATLDVTDLRKQFSVGRPAIDGVSFAVPAGEIVVLLGPSGCGKTTTLRCVAGLEHPTAGTISIAGRVVSSPAHGILLPPRLRDIGMVFQSYAVWPHMTVRQNVVYPLKHRKIRRADAGRMVDEVLELVGLSEYADRSVVALSGGQMQRVALARSIVYSPQLLLLDEPLSNLDAKLRLRLRDDLRRILKQTGMTALYVTHDQAEAATGFMMFEYSLCGKWLELLKQIAPRVTRAVVLRDPAIEAGIGQFAVIQSVAPSVGVEVSPVNLSNAAEIKSEVAAFAGSANGGLILTASALSQVHRDLIITLAAQYKLPAVYQESSYVAHGGLASYGSNFIDQFRRAAGYVDRILKGEKPGDLPVQAPTKYELAINLKTAKALGLTVPPTLLARADEVIE